MTTSRAPDDVAESTAARIELARAGDEASLRQLYEQHRGAVMRLAHGLLGDRDEAEDLMQDTMVWALTHLDRFDPERAAFGTWLQVIARSRGYDRLRRRQRRQRGLKGLLRGRRAEAVDESMAGLPARLDARLEVGRALSELTPLQREALLLHDVEGWSFRAMSEHLDISLRTAQSRVLSAHRAMKRGLDDQPKKRMESLGEEDGARRI